MKPASEWADAYEYDSTESFVLEPFIRAVQADAIKAAADAVRDAVFRSPRTVREDAVAAIEKLLPVPE